MFVISQLSQENVVVSVSQVWPVAIYISGHDSQAIVNCPLYVVL